MTIAETFTIKREVSGAVILQRCCVFKYTTLKYTQGLKRVFKKFGVFK